MLLVLRFGEMGVRYILEPIQLRKASICDVRQRKLSIVPKMEEHFIFYILSLYLEFNR